LAGYPIAAEHPALVALATDPAAFQCPSRCDREIHIERQMTESVRLDRRVDPTKPEDNQPAVEERKRARGVLLAQRGVEGIDCIGGRSRALREGASRHGDESEEKGKSSEVHGAALTFSGREIAISSTTKTSLTARPFNGPSSVVTVISDSVLPCTSKTLAKRTPASKVRRQPRNSFGTYPGAAGSGVARKE